MTDPETLAAPPAKATQPRWIAPLVTGVVGLVLGAAIAVGVMGAVNGAAASAAAAKQQQADAARKSILPKALGACSLSDDDDSQIGDGGYTLTVNNKGNDDFTGISTVDLACLQKALHTPSSVVSHLDQTTSMDGRQTETWGVLTESWSYHPDRGLDAVFTVKK